MRSFLEDIKGTVFAIISSTLPTLTIENPDLAMKIEKLFGSSVSRRAL